MILDWQGEVSVKELDSLLALLAEKKHKAEQEEAEANMEILLEFLHRSRQSKQDELNEVRDRTSRQLIIHGPIFPWPNLHGPIFSWPNL